MKKGTKLYIDLFEYFKKDLSANMPFPPLFVYIEPVNVCNLNCPFCATAAMKREKCLLDFNLYKKAIDQIVALGWHRYLRLGLQGQGESLLNKNLPEMIKYAKEKGIACLELITNATLLNKEISRKLIVYGLDKLQLSVDSINKRTYDKMRQAKVKNKSYFYDTMNNILFFLYLNNKHGYKVSTSISAIISTLNKKQKDGFLRFWRSLPIDNVFFPPLSTLQNDCPYPGVKRFDGDIKNKQICLMPWIGLNIKSNGDVVACCHDFHNRYRLGNIKKQKIGDIWNNPKIEKLRKALLTGNLGYFVKLKHDCVSCNNPCIGLGRDDFIKNAALYMQKTVFRKLYRKPVPLKRIRNLQVLLNQDYRKSYQSIINNEKDA